MCAAGGPLPADAARVLEPSLTCPGRHALGMAGGSVRGSQIDTYDVQVGTMVAGWVGFSRYAADTY